MRPLGVRRRSLAEGVADRGSIRTDGEADREERESDGGDVRLVPRGRDLRGEPEHGAEREEDRRREPADRSDRQASERPPAQRDVSSGEHREEQPIVGGEAPDGNERHEQDGGKGRERQQPTRDPVRRRHREDVLEERVAGQDTVPGHRITDRCVALEERCGLPHEVVVVPVDAGDEVDRERGERQHDRRHERKTRVGAGLRGGSGRFGFGVRGATLCYAPVHLPRSCRSRRTR